MSDTLLKYEESNIDARSMSQLLCHLPFLITTIIYHIYYFYLENIILVLAHYNPNIGFSDSHFLTERSLVFNILTGASI